MGKVAQALAKIHKQETSEYTKQAEVFLHNTGTVFSATFIEHGRHFESDKQSRDIYEISLKRGSREWKFRFGQSITHSGIVHAWGLSCDTFRHAGVNCVSAHNLIEVDIADYYAKDFKLLEKRVEPSSYSVLATITKSDPGSFENFCSEFGYDNDSKTAEKIYKAVKDEWSEVQKLFSDEEIELMWEIQ